MFALGERATSMNEQVSIRADDLRFVLDVVAGPEQASAELETLVARIDPNRIGLAGMSLGGATVIDVCKTDSGCRAGVNLQEFMRRWYAVSDSASCTCSRGTEPQRGGGS